MTPLISTWFVQIPTMALLLLLGSYSIAKILVYFAAQRERQKSLLNKINQILPQTQCGQCGHLGCLPYALAIRDGEAINKCPPGGMITILELASLLNEPVKPLDTAHGEFRPLSVALIREEECIGCTKCIQACPVDAILGAPKLMHTVIESECTGCDLCIEPCPVDCIDMLFSDNSAQIRLSNTSFVNGTQQEALGSNALENTL